MSDFKYFDQLEDGKFLIIETDRLEETIKFIKDEKIENIYISEFHGYKLENINPLIELKGIKKIQYQEGSKLISMQGIEQFTELEYLRIDDEQKVDLGAFPNLKFLLIKWSKKIINFDKCNALEELNIWNFNTKNKDFSDLPYLENLKRLDCYFGMLRLLMDLKHQMQLKK